MNDLNYLTTTYADQKKIEEYNKPYVPKEIMMKQYFTFGQIHAHSVSGKTFDKDCVVEIEGTDESDCRQKMFQYFGDKWCFQHSREEIDKQMDYYPRGIMTV